ncbi:MAG: sensor histidine kinase [Pseudomonadota bacterium]
MKRSILKRLADQDYGVDRWVAALTWGLLAISCLYFLAQRDSTPIASVHWNVTAVSFLLFYLAFHFATRDAPLPNEPWLRIALVAAQFVLVVFLFLLVPYNFVAILMVLWAAQLPYFIPLNKAIALSPLIALPHFLVYQFFWHDNYAWLSAVLFWTFIIFSMTMMGTQLREARARENEQRINRELRATQALLAEASKQNERTRIARNIHDLLGHHLTALSINLQVAERNTEGEAKALVAKSRSIAQLLLTDVREAVSTIRASESINISKALDALHVDVPGKTIVIECPSSLSFNDIDTAEAILAMVQESLTNFLRHSGGDAFTANIKHLENEIHIAIRDNGHATKSVDEGNGLQGLRERITLAGGQLSYSFSEGMSLHAILPTDRRHD